MHPYIKNLKINLKKQNHKGLALDIDDTLSKSSDYYIKSTMDQFGNPENLSLDQIKTKYRYQYNAPYWQTKENRTWEKQIRHDHQFHQQIPLIKNANHIVQKIHKTIPVVVYLTARTKSILTTTKAWLNKHHFPKAPIIYRPKEIKLSKNTIWKAKVLEFLYPQIIAMVDDHPDLAKNLSKNYQGTLFIYNYHDQTPRSDINVYPTKNWPDILQKIKNLKYNN